MSNVVTCAEKMKIFEDWNYWRKNIQTKQNEKNERSDGTKQKVEVIGGKELKIANIQKTKCQQNVVAAKKWGFKHGSGASKIPKYLSINIFVINYRA